MAGTCLAVLIPFERLSPMLLTSAERNPIDDDRGWAFEAKWDGFRVLVAIASGTLRIRSRHGTDFTAAFPELARLPAATKASSVTLDCELVCFGSDGRTSFGKVRRRWGPAARAQAAALARSCPATLVIFDQLELNGISTLGVPYRERRAQLAELRLRDQHWLITDYHVGQGEALAAASKDQRLEGLVAKRLGSRYQPGVRSLDWRKLKNYDRTTLIAGGWLPGEGGSVKALYVGRHDEAGDLIFAGTIEIGVDWHQRALREAVALLGAERSPFARWERSSRARWLQPLLSASVRFIGYDAGVLREPILEGLGAVAAEERRPALPSPPPAVAAGRGPGRRSGI
jgi:bifunctional non-homologous end joining protein LigD